MLRGTDSHRQCGHRSHNVTVCGGLLTTGTFNRLSDSFKCSSKHQTSPPTVYEYAILHIYIDTNIYIYIYIYIYVYIYICIQTPPYIYVYIYIYTYMYAQRERHQHTYIYIIYICTEIYRHHTCKYIYIYGSHSRAAGGLNVLNGYVYFHILQYIQSMFCAGVSVCVCYVRDLVCVM